MGLGSFTPWFLVLAAEAHLVRGEVDAAAKAVETSEAMIAHSRGSLFSSETARCRAGVAAARGDPAAAAQLLEAALAQAQSKGLTLFAVHAARDLTALGPQPGTASLHPPRRAGRPPEPAGRIDPVPGA